MALKIGVIGNGTISRYHGLGYKALGDRVEIVACCDLVEEKAKKYPAAPLQAFPLGTK